jgi:hypothetical protein
VSGSSRRAPSNWPGDRAGVVWTGRIIEMYREVMDQTARDEITAAAAAHRELGPQYDRAMAESLVERIGEEIDRRVDARLGSPPAPSPRPEAKRPARAEPRPPGRGNVASVVLALGSMGIGIGVAGTVLNSGSSNVSSGGAIFLVMVVWIIIGVINVAYARRH